MNSSNLSVAFVIIINNDTERSSHWFFSWLTQEQIPIRKHTHTHMWRQNNMWNTHNTAQTLTQLEQWCGQVVWRYRLATNFSRAGIASIFSGFIDWNMNWWRKRWHHQAQTVQTLPKTPSPKWDYNLHHKSGHRCCAGTLNVLSLMPLTAPFTLQ